MSGIDRYLLQNKDNTVAKLVLTEQYDEPVFILEKEIKGQLPIGFTDINKWIDGRKACQHNQHLKEIMKKLGCEDRVGFVRMTHSASINDTFWIKREDENVKWRDISLYTNQFTETISRLAFEGIGLYDEVFSSASPELVTEGSFKKCFRKENDTIYIYKRGSENGINTGLEPYCESMASEISRLITKNAVKYDCVTLHDKLASKCELFTDEQKGFISFARFSKDKDTSTLAQLFDLMNKLGFEDKFRDMLVIDSVIFNQDRHNGNFGFLFNNDTLDIMDFAPIFDLNLSLFVYAMKKEFDKPGDLLSGMGPKIGNDFLRVGQIALRDEIRDKLKSLCDFEFTFKGDDKFEPWRVKTVTEIVQRQANAILKNEKLYTKDVFIPETPLILIPDYDNLVALAQNAPQPQSDLLEYSECIDNENIMISYMTFINDTDIQISFDYTRLSDVDKCIFFEVDGKNMDKDQFFKVLQHHEDIKNEVNHLIKEFEKQATDYCKVHNYIK